MTIEKEINQIKPFKNLREKAMVNLMFTHGWLVEELRNYFKPFDITLKQYNILRILRGAKEPLTTSHIRERMIDKMSDTTRLIARMIIKGWVDKKICPEDRRLVDIVITQKGLDKLDQIELSKSNIEEILSPLTQDDSIHLSDLLDKLRSTK